MIGMTRTDFNPARQPGLPPDGMDNHASVEGARIWKCAACGVSYGYNKPEPNPGACEMCGHPMLINQDIPAH